MGMSSDNARWRAGSVLGAVVMLSMFLSAPEVRAQTSSTNGLFWLKCPASHRLPDDPIVHPGQPGATHLHEFFSNRSTNAGST
jgi:hypothetical protein